MKLATSDEIVIKAIKPKYSLKIEKLRAKNFGDYTCRASNELGSTEAVIPISGQTRSATNLREDFTITVD